MAASAPEVASHLPSCDQETSASSTDSRSCACCPCRASRQPCSVFSCMEVTTKRPSGDQVTSRCEPFHSSISGSASVLGNHRLDAVVVAHREPIALRREGEARASRAPRASSSRPLSSRPSRACRRTRRRRRRRERQASIQRPSSRRDLASAVGAVAATRPSSPPVTKRSPSLAPTRIPRPDAPRRGCVSPSGCDQQHGAVAEAERRVPLQPADAGDMRAARRAMAATVSEERVQAAGYVMSRPSPGRWDARHERRLKPRSPESPRGSPSRSGRGR